MVLKVQVTNYVTTARHGLYAIEQHTGNTFRINVSVWFTPATQFEHDRIEDTLDYVSLIACIDTEMQVIAATLEHLACRIVNQIKHRFPIVEGGILKIEKLRPPISEQVESVGIELNF